MSTPLFGVNKNNQLLVKLPEEKRPELLPGKFETDENNRLIYHLSQPQFWKRKYNIPNKIIFEGKWSLDSDHNLVLKLQKKKKLGRKNFILRGKILEVGKDFLLFQIRSREEKGITRIFHIRLKGIWSSDRFNRIRFEIQKRHKPDVLIFRNAWQLNKSKQIIYNYKKLVTKTEHTLIFKGFWEIYGRRKLSYLLEKSNQSRFNFGVNLETPNLYSAKNKLKYSVWIGFKKFRTKRIVVFSGRWKFSKKLGVVFEMDYGRRQLRRIEFLAKIKLAHKNELLLSLYSSDRKPSEINITFRRDQLKKKDYDYFLQLKKERKKFIIGVGGKIYF